MTNWPNYIRLSNQNQPKIKIKKKKFEKDINAVTHPIVAPINRDNVNIPKKSPTDLKKARVSNSPPLE